MAILLGRAKKLYVSADGQEPSWSEVTLTRDATITLTSAEADVSRRGAAWKLSQRGLMECSIEAELLYDVSDTTVDMIRSAYLDGAALWVGATDGGITASGTKGIKFRGYVYECTMAEPLDGPATIRAVFKPTDEPQQIEVT